MPSTLSGLLLFVALMLPGFAYLVVKERAGTERRTSPFRETVAVVAASVAAELVAFFGSAVLWVELIDVKRLVASPDSYWRAEPLLLAGWAVSLLALATVLAAAAAWPWIRTRLPGDYPHDSTVSAWWMIFAKFDKDADKRVACELDDGSYVEGNLVSYNNNADDIEDRDIILDGPILFRPAGPQQSAEPYDAHVVCISARRIVTMFVTYSEPKESESTTGSEAESVEAAASSHTEGSSDS